MKAERLDETMVEQIAALLYEEATGEPWAVAGVEHPGPDRDYYRGLARKVAALASAPPSAPDRDAYEGAREDLLDWKRRAQRAESTLRGLGYKGIDASEPPSAPVGVEGLMQLAREWCLSWGEWAHDNDPDCKKENAAEAALRAALTTALAKQPAADQFIATFRCENSGIVGTTDAKVHSVSQHDDGVIEVVIDHWPQQPAAPSEEAVSGLNLPNPSTGD